MSPRDEETWRLFVAVPLGEQLRRSLVRYTKSLDREPSMRDVRWTDPTSWHLTLAFLGATRPGAVQPIVDVVAAIGHRETRFKARTGGLGAFPSRKAARVIWYGIEDRGGIREVAQRLNSAPGTATLGPVQPHITLGRVSKQANPGEVATWLRSAHPPTGELVVDRLILYRSRTGESRSDYVPLAEVTLPR